MAGPTASVLTPGQWTPEDLTELRAWLAKSFSSEGDSDWWMLREGRRLGTETFLEAGSMLVELTRYECDDDNEEASVSHAVGYLPGAEVVLAAAVNGKDDHQLLAHLAVAIARRQGGFIDLGALLPMPAAPDASALSPLGTVGNQERDDRSRTTIATLSGRWHEIPYRTAGGATAAYHLVDADLLASWLRHPLFRMVK